MKTLIIATFIFAYFYIPLSAQPAIQDPSLIATIDSMFKTDQFWRLESMKINSNKQSAYDQATIEKNWAVCDSINELKAKVIINKYGYPGYRLAGEAASKRFWTIIQHCDDDIAFQEQVLSLMKKEIVNNNAGKDSYAYLADRILINKHQKQLYGTQLRMDSKTHKFAPLPLKDPGMVNKLRREMGLTSLAEYVKTANNF